MNNDEFKQKLSQVAQWSIPKLSPTDVMLAKKAKRGKGKRTNEERYQEEHEELFIEIFNGVNPTHPIELESVCKMPATCNDCGRTCPEGREKDFKLFKGKEKTAWRQKCIACKQYQNPYTKQFELDVNQAQSAMNSYVNGVEDSEFINFNSEDTKIDK